MSTTDLWLTFSSLKLVCLQVKKPIHKHFIGILFDVQAEKKVQASEEATTALAKFGEKPLGISIGGFTCINGSCWGWRIVKFHGFSNEKTFPAQFRGIFLQFWNKQGMHRRNYTELIELKPSREQPLERGSVGIIVIIFASFIHGMECLDLSIHLYW